MITRIITFTFLIALLLTPAAYAEYPTSTPESMEPVNLIDGIKDAFHSITGSTSSSETGGGAESIAGGLSAMMSAPIITWSGLGTDNLASTDTNWSGDTAPRNGDGVVFDSTSKNCTWDLPITLASLSINAGYEGKVTVEEDFTISGDFIWTGLGEDNLASNSANWSRNAVPEEDDKIVFNGTSIKDCVWDVNVSPSSFSIDSTYSGTIALNTEMSITGDLYINGGIFDLNNKTLDVNGNLFIGPDGTLYGTSSVIKVRGDWINRGTFVPETSTVMLIGMNQIVYGDNTFFNLIKITDAAYTLLFEAGKTQIILNNLTLLGTAGNLLYLKSTVDGQQWYLDAKGTRYISYTSIRDLNNISSVEIEVINSDNVDNNTNLYFEYSQCAYLDNRRILGSVLHDDRRKPC